nr:hypothetical protein [uncultured Duganella sp.]
MKLVDGIGKDREKALDDLKSDEGKNTSVGFNFQVPSAACVNPTVRVPGFAGSWEVDICQYVTLFGAMFEALWSALFVFGVMSMVARATAKPVA